MESCEAIEMVKVQVQPSGLVNRANAAKALNRKAKTLADWKCKGIGPRPVNVGGRIFYSWAEVQAMARGEKPLVPVVATVA